MTLNDILQGAQGFKATDNLAARFGLSSTQAQTAVQAMIPAFSLALQNLASRPPALGGLLSELASGAHGPSFAEPGQASIGDAEGAAALEKVFGSPEAIRRVVDHVAEASGVGREAIQGMLPAVASILLGGLAHAMAGEGQSGVLADLANAAAAPGGLGSAIGSGGGFFGSIFGSIFGGSHEPADPRAAALAAGLASLSAMFAAGVQASQAQQASLGAIAQSFTQPPPTV